MDTTTSSSKVFNTFTEDFHHNRRHSCTKQSRSLPFPTLSSSQAFLAQSIAIWICLSWPGILVTLYLYFSLDPPENIPPPPIATLSLGNNGSDISLAICQGLTSAGNCSEDVIKAETCRQRLNENLTLLMTKKTTLQKLLPECFGEEETRSWLQDPTLATTTPVPFQEVCHESREECTYLVEACEFWIEGVGVSVLGIFGLLGNVVTISVLHRMKHNKNFNNLLIGLGVADLLLIIVQLIEKPLFKVWVEEPSWYKKYIPYLVHPVKGFIQTLAIYMVVAVSTERFKAVCNPFQKRQPYYKFIFVAVLISFSLIVPRFFELRLTHNNTDYQTTYLMEDPDYIQFNSYWNKLFAVGLFPLISLSYMNFKIYLRIRSSSQFAQSFVSSSTSNSRRNCITQTRQSSPREEDSSGSPASLNRIIHVNGTNSNEGSMDAAKALTTTSFQPIEMKVMTKKPNSRKKRTPFPKRQTTLDTNMYTDNGLITEESVASISMNDRCSMNIKYIRKRREKSTIILVSIVVIFIISHVYHLALRFYELLHPHSNTIQNYERCKSKGLYHIPVTFYINVNFHELMIVFNSSVNFIIYCCVAKDFRNEAYRFFTRK